MIAFNALLLTPYAGGIATYIQNLLKFFEHFEEKENILVYLAKDQFQYYESKLNLRLIPTSLPSGKALKRIILERFYWKRILIEDSIRLFHSPISYLPFNLSTKSIVTIHDLRVFRYPETYTKSRRIFLRYAIANSILNSTKIITVSEFTKSEILQLFNIDEHKIKVIYEGIDDKYYNNLKKDNDIDILRHYNIQYPYVLTLGHLEPRKNFLRLISAFEFVYKKTNRLLQLVIIGQENFLFKSIYEQIKRSEIADKIIITGFVESNHLKVLYRNADIFVFPSIYEGFGFPPLEALSSGIPVAASNTSSIPEIIGRAAIYFDPYSVDDMADKILRLFEDNDLKMELKTNTTAVLNKYNWKNCARDTLNLYREIMNGD